MPPKKQLRNRDPKKRLKNKLDDKLTIFGTHYHCKDCGCEMRELARLPWQVKNGVGCVHVCPKCGKLFIENEYDE